MQLSLPRDFPWHYQLCGGSTAPHPRRRQTTPLAPRSSELVPIAVWSAAILLMGLSALVAGGCAASAESSPRVELRSASQASPDIPRDEPMDLTTTLSQIFAAPVPASQVACDIPICLRTSASSPVAHASGEFQRKNDVPLRPPLRQTWFHHPALVPLEDDAEFGLPHSEFLAHRGASSFGNLRNPYAGLRDQPILHRDTSRAPVTDSTLRDVGPSPPRHTLKTFGTLTALSLIGIGVYAWAPTSLTGADHEDE
jgi:hypothetical protein